MGRSHSSLVQSVVAAGLVILGCGNTSSHSSATTSNDAGAPAQMPGGAGTGGAGATATGSNGSLDIVGVAERSAGACTVKVGAGTPRLAQGTLDRLFASDYTAALLVGDTFTDRVSLQGTKVQLTSAAGDPLGDAFTTAAQGFVDAGNSAVVFATLIPASRAAALPTGEVRALVRVFGTTLAQGKMLETAEQVFPIQICDGCLVEYPDSARDPQAAGTGYQCLVPADGDPNPAPAPCALGLDEPFSCTLCSATIAACKSPANNPSH